MSFSGWRRHGVLAAVGIALVASGFPALAFIGDGEGVAELLLLVPVTLVSWCWGEWVGLLAALGGVVYTNVTLLAGNLVVHHRSVSARWLLVVIVSDLLAVYLAVVVGKLSEAIQEKGAAEGAVRSSADHLQAVLRAVLRAVPDHVLEFDRRGTVHDSRSSGTDSWQDPRLASSIGRAVTELWSVEASAIVMSAIAEAGEKGHSGSRAFSVTREGRTRWYETTVAAIGDHQDPEGRFIALVRDITERKTLEQQLAESQKMEAIGRLAGGIAHDFNNILQVIIGFCELILGKAGHEPQTEKQVTTIREAALRAASLTQHLLAFSRRQMLIPRVIDVDALVRESLEMLGRMLGEHISATHTTDGGENRVRADPGQFGQVITNLAVNARDAMPFGGRLTIRVRRVDLAAADPSRPAEVVPGPYVLLQVTDTGTGMDEETLSHLFEPFFTTKVLGRGTGLGLSIVYGAVKQSGGYITVDSRPGAGTTFSLYFPRVSEGESARANCADEEHVGTETVLLVEDEEDVRRLIHRHLSGCGYRVVQAADGRTALDALRQGAGPIDLLLVDVVLPDIRGDRVAQEFRLAFPKGKVVFMTGYTDTTGLVETVQRESAAILQKPFTLSSLGRRVRLALDESSGTPA